MFKHGFPPEWSMLKKLIWLVGSGIAGAAGIWKTVTGTLIHITDALASPMQKCEVTLEPIQAGSGDPSPDNVRPITGWTGANAYVTGVNVWDEEVEYGRINTSTGENSPTAGTRSKNYIPVMPSTKYYVKFNSTTSVIYIIEYDINKEYVRYASYYKNASYTTSGNARYIRFYTIDENVPVGAISINYPSTDTDYHAYSGTTLSVTFPDSTGTVYGGTYDFVSGGLKPYKEYDSYNGETLTGEWMSSMDKYVAGTTPTIGAQVVDLDGYDTIVQLTPQPISTLAGENNVWSNSNGDTTIIYKAQA